MGRKSGRLPATSFRTRWFSITSLFLMLWVVIGAASPTALQGIANAVADNVASARWATVLAKPPIYSRTTLPKSAGALADLNLYMPFLGDGGLRESSTETTRGSDQERVVRKYKGARILSIRNQESNETLQTGAIPDLQMPSLRPSFDHGGSFTSTELLDEPQVAASFHSKEDDRLAGVPSTLADLVTNDGADILATAYAPTDPYHPPASPFDSLLQSNEDLGRFVPPMANGDHDWMKNPLPAAAFSEDEQKCLATAVYFEARGESIKGQAAVTQVILNRVRNPAYPNFICDVVYQNATWSNRCQFSFACDGIPDRIADRRAYRLARDISMAVTGGKIFLSEVASSTHYYASYVNPRWAQTMEKMTKIGSHLFFRTYGGGWS